MDIVGSAFLGLASLVVDVSVSKQAAVAEVVPPVMVVEVARRYTLTGSSFSELRSQLLPEHLPEESGGSNGRTRSQISVSYDFAMHANRCSLTKAEVALRITTTLPEWKPSRKDVPRSLVQHWEDSLAALVKHEATHANHARGAAEEVRAGLLGLREMPRCKDLAWAVERNLQRARMRLDLKDQRFDQRTDFGRLDTGAR